MRRGCLVAVLIVALLATPAFAQGEASNDAQRKQTEQKLDAVRSAIRALTAEIQASGAERDAAGTALREAETAISAAITAIERLDAELAEGEAELAKLEARSDKLAHTLREQREALAALLRSAYALGRNEELKLLLQQEDVASIARVLAYHRYFQGARVERIDDLLGQLRQLAEVGKAIAAQQAELTTKRDRRRADAAALDARRGERAAALADIEARLGEQKARLDLMHKDEKSLADLLERLRDVFADIPKRIAGAEPFASLRGKLPKPANGRVRTAFGDRDASGRSSSGILIGAASGSPVSAVARGRVAFADWLKGYGMLLILDHGDGYMSLYGYNESLRKEVGDWVDAGEVIASSGASGGQQEAGLYFEIRHDGKPVNPKSWLR